MQENNPFKLWGSWTGAITFPIVLWVLFLMESRKVAYIGMAILPAIILSIVLIPVGFFVGWGINALIRKNRVVGTSTLALLIIALTSFFFLTGNIPNLGTAATYYSDNEICDPNYEFVCFNVNIDENIPAPVRVKDLASDSQQTHYDQQGIALLHWKGSNMYVERDGVWSYRAGLGRLRWAGNSGSASTGAMVAPCGSLKKYNWRPDKVQWACDTWSPVAAYTEVEIMPINKDTFMMHTGYTCKNGNGCDSEDTAPYIETRPTSGTVEYGIWNGYPGYKISQTLSGSRMNSINMNFYLLVNVTPDYHSDNKLRWNLNNGESMTVTSIWVTENGLDEAAAMLGNTNEYIAQSKEYIEDWFNMFKYPHNAKTSWEKKRYYYAWYDFWFNILSKYGDVPTLWGDNEIIKPGAGYEGEWIWDSFFGAWAFAAGCKDYRDDCLAYPRQWLQVLINNKYPNGQWAREVWYNTKGQGWQAPGGWPWVIWQLHRKSADVPYLCSVYPELKGYHEWAMTTDKDGNNIFEWGGTNSGWDGSLRWNEGKEALDLQGWMILGAEALSEMSKICAPQDTSTWEQRVTDYRAAAQQMWDGEYFRDLDRDNNPTSIKSAAMLFMPFADASTPSQTQKIIQELYNPQTFGDINGLAILPTVSRDTPGYAPNGERTWSGAVWVNINLVAWLGLKRQGFDTAADYLREATLNTLKIGQIGYESYNGNTGKKVTSNFGGWPYIWSDTAYIAMMLDWMPFSPPPECPDITCDIYCENGFKRDENGCYTCECIKPSDPCEGISCPPTCQGSNRLVNGQCVNGICHYESEPCEFGCQDGVCVADPCADSSCGDGVCNAQCGETQYTCVADCGDCSPGSVQDCVDIRGFSGTQKCQESGFWGTCQIEPAKPGLGVYLYPIFGIILLISLTYLILKKKK